MNITINERQQCLLENQVISQEIRDRVKKVASEKKELEDFIESNGEYMTDVTNNKTYLVQYLKALSALVGKDYAMCAPVRRDGTYGAFYVKPWESFIKDNNIVRNNNIKNQRLKKNLYQMLGLNK